MKKVWKFSKFIIFIIVFGGSVVGCYFWDYPYFSSKRIEKINISSFKGRVVKADSISPGTFKLDVPFESSLKWKENAILSYGANGFNDGSIQVWKPDPLTSGVFLYSYYSYEAPWNYTVDKICYNSGSNSREIVFKMGPKLFWITLIIFGQICLIVIVCGITAAILW
ncbi:MAG: hypothetical protein WDK96_00505 [Candidatus Paceibacterota bacterium]|jgi:hypothetical protein